MAALCRAGWIELTSQSVATTPALDSLEDLTQLETEKDRLLAEYPDMTSQANLVWVAMSACAEILSGEVAGTDVIFPDSSTDLVEGVYKGNPQVDHYNRALADNVLAYVRHRVPDLGGQEKIRILEVGAGTGSTGAMVFPAVQEFGAHLHYVYTDISPGFMQYGKKAFGDDYPFVDFKLLDIEKDINGQDVDTFGFDMVIATNVFHATRRINRTLAHAKGLLKRSGWLVINEGVRNLDFLTYTFGLLKGWWLYEDAAARLPGGPLLDHAMWEQVLTEEGYTSFQSLNAEAGAGQNLILAVSDGIARTAKDVPPKAKPRPEAKAAAPKKTADLAGPGGLKNWVEQSMADCIVEALDVDPEDIRLERPLTDYGVDSITGVDLINRINETFKIQLRTTSLFDHAHIQAFAEALLDEFGEQFETQLQPDDPTEPEPVAPESFGPDRSRELREPQVSTKVAETDIRAVVLTQPGSLDDMQIRAIDPPPPAADELDIEVRAFSLNFGDWLCVRGLYPNMPPYPFTPGSEVSGVVLSVGSGVTTFQPGDEVIALMEANMGGHAERVMVREELAVHKPARVSHEEACAFPVAFMTAHHAFELARVQPGDKILIQTAAGGVGLLAVRIALAHGAEIFATAGSRAKLDYLKEMGVPHLINYREEDFAARILELTDGYGVDVIFNTLADDAIQKGLDLLAPEGRYIEIAMAGLKTARQLDLSNLVDNQTVQTVDMSRLYTRRPERRAEHLSVMARTLAEGNITPTLGHTFTFDEVREAYRCLENRENIGKVVVSIPAKTSPTVQAGEENGPAREPVRTEGIAVIGMSGRFPGAPDLDAFWILLAGGKSAITEIPPERWDVDAFYDPDPKNLEKTHCRWGGFLGEIDRFDALFFKMSGREAELTDPQQRVFLEEAWRALEDAGYAKASSSNIRCGVFVGADSGDYLAHMREHQVAYEPQSFWGNAASLVAARISYLLNLKGPSVAVDTACSSSLAAVHMACQSIRQGESEMAIEGGVYIGTTPKFHIAASNAGMLAPDGRCKVFDQRADGFVPGEGVGAVVFKPLAAARRDGDVIHGIIRESGMNQDGRTYGITAPSAASQAELEADVYERAELNPQTIGYLEAHGTGTRLGDPIEIDALTKAFASLTDRKGYCAIGSVKTNIGHAAMAAGIAGLIKVLLCLKHEKLVPSLNYETRNEHIDFDNSPFYVNTTLKDWPAAEGYPRRAAISSFGFSGTNAHVVVEEAASVASRPADEVPELIVLSAKTMDRLKVVAEKLRGNSSHRLADIAYTLQTGREAMSARLAFVAVDKKDLDDKLSAFLHDRLDDGIVGEVQDGAGGEPAGLNTLY
ncbi:MAG: beta-ketoacyl synthase N-terminal-like domain-containing protein, partial [Verrucomicrobiota bacterium]